MECSMQKKYNLEFKIEAVKLILENGYSLQEACQNLDVPYKTLSKWKNEYLAGILGTPKKSQLTEEQKELKKLRKENTRLKLEREILKKAAAFFAKETN